MHTRTEIPLSPSAGAAYGFCCTLDKTAFADAVARVTDAPKTEGFGVPTDIILGFMDPVVVMQLAADPEVAKVADEVRSHLERVRPALAPTPGKPAKH